MLYLIRLTEQIRLNNAESVDHLSIKLQFQVPRTHLAHHNAI